MSNDPSYFDTVETPILNILNSVNRVERVYGSVNYQNPVKYEEVINDEKKEISMTVYVHDKVKHTESFSFENRNDVDENVLERLRSRFLGNIYYKFLDRK